MLRSYVFAISRDGGKYNSRETQDLNSQEIAVLHIVTIAIIPLYVQGEFDPLA